MTGDKVLDEAKLLNAICKVAKNRDWLCSLRENYVIFSVVSPAGQDFNVEVNIESPYDIPEHLDEFICAFDISEETYCWLDSFGHGTNGAPYDMRDVYDDMEWCLNETINLANDICKSVFR